MHDSEDMDVHKKIHAMKWPSESPDLNPIEKLLNKINTQNPLHVFKNCRRNGTNLLLTILNQLLNLCLITVLLLLLLKVCLLNTDYIIYYCLIQSFYFIIDQCGQKIFNMCICYKNEHSTSKY